MGIRFIEGSDTGSRFGKLTIVKRDSNIISNGKSRAMFICECDCGVIKTILWDTLKNGSITSCGCSFSKSYHGKSKDYIYRIYRDMIRRCYSKNRKYYDNYGGRGITVCNRWLEKPKGFENFYKDMGDRPSDNYSIDRINNDGNYEPNNCKWSDSKEQNYNRRDTIFITHNDKSMNIEGWSKETGLPEELIRARHYEKMDVKDMLTTQKIEPTLYKYKDIERPLQEWASILGIKYLSLYKRIHCSGWSIDRAFSTPPRKTINNKYVY